MPKSRQSPWHWLSNYHFCTDMSKPSATHLTTSPDTRPVCVNAFLPAEQDTRHITNGFSPVLHRPALSPERPMLTDSHHSSFSAAWNQNFRGTVNSLLSFCFTDYFQDLQMAPRPCLWTLVYSHIPERSVTFKVKSVFPVWTMAWQTMAHGPHPPTPCLCK